MVEKYSSARSWLAPVFSLTAAALFVLQLHGSMPALIVLDSSNAAQAKASATRVPPGWDLKVIAGQPDISIADQDLGPVLHFRSTRSSFALERNIDVNPAQMPVIAWSWKVAQLPKGGDFRHGSSDDQAAQLMVAFTDRRILDYIWDTTAPQGASEDISPIPFVHIFTIVCRSGSAEVNQWLQENRNVAADYQKAFGKPAPHVKGVRIQINSQHTGTSAESYFGEVAFRNAQI